MTNLKTQQNTGFALLLTLVVVSVVLSIGLSLLDITLKQLVLSGTARDSEIAFHAAYAGIECAEYWVREDYTDFMGGSSPRLAQCINSDVAAAEPYSSPASNVHKSTYTISWSVDGEDRCTNFDVFILDAETAEDDVTYDFSTIGYTSKTCTAGGVCTYMFSRGYNRACNELDSLQTVQREIVSQF